MEKNKWPIHLENTIYNWYYGGSSASPIPIFNAMQGGLANNMQVIVPIETPDSMVKAIGDPGKLKPGDSYSLNEEVLIRFCRFVIDKDENYYIPAFTSEAEMKKGQTASVINQSVSALMDVAKKWPKCLGYVINPWDRQLMLGHDLIDAIMAHEAISQICFIKGKAEDLHVDALVKRMDTIEKKKEKPEHAEEVIYADNIRFSGKEKEDILLCKNIRACLDKALKKECYTVAFPGLSASVDGEFINEAAGLALSEVIKWFEAHPDYVINVYFCTESDAEFAAYMDLTQANM